MSHTGRMIRHSSGSTVMSPHSAMPTKIAIQPSRVAARTMPMAPHATASEIGMPGNSEKASSPNAVPTKTAGKMRPPRKPALAATSSATILTAVNRASCCDV